MKKRKLGLIIVLALFLLLGIAKTAFTSFNDHIYTATVTGKDRITQYSENSYKSYYLIFCKDDAGNYYEFKDSDSLVRMKFNSSSVYNQLEIGQTYKFTVVGYRVPLLSWYENIIKFEKMP